MISTGFNESHFEFRVNQELYGFSVSSLDSSSRKTGVINQNLVFIYFRC